MSIETNPAAVPNISTEQVAVHNSEGDCWMTIEGSVYNVSSFISLHPGGRKTLVDYCGKDASVPFNNVRHGQDAITKRATMLVAKSRAQCRSYFSL